VSPVQYTAIANSECVAHAHVLVPRDAVAKLRSSVILAAGGGRARDLLGRKPTNVATSRAKCLCILVGSPAVYEAECRTPRQMQLANAFCRYLEMAKTI